MIGATALSLIFSTNTSRSKAGLKPVGSASFCGAGDDAMCSIRREKVDKSDDHVFEHGAKSSVLLLIAVLASSAFSVSVHLETDTEQVVAVETYVILRDPLEKQTRVSTRRSQNEIEGWVPPFITRFRASGSPYEIEIIDSSGNKISRTNGQTRNWKLISIFPQPAQMNGFDQLFKNGLRIQFELSEV